MAKISIIMPVYNVEAYLNRAIDSVLEQSYKDFELILIDDGSSDNSGKICNSYQEHEKVKVIHKENGGVSSARNAGIRLATGDYVAFIDADDYIHPTMYEKMITCLLKNKADVVMASFKQVFENGKELDVVEKSLDNINSKNILDCFITTGWEIKGDKKITNNIMASVWRFVFKREVVKDLKFSNLKIYEDLAFMVDVFDNDLKLSVVSEPLYTYCVRNDSAMNSIDGDMVNSRLAGYRAIVEKLEGKTNADLYNAYKFYAYCDLINFVLKHNRKDLLDILKRSKFFNSLNTKENYKAEKKLEKRFTRKFGYFLLHKKMIGLYSMLLKIIK